MWWYKIKGKVTEELLNPNLAEVISIFDKDK